MTIKLYKYHGDNRKIEKSIELVQTISNATVVETMDIINPVIILEVDQTFSSVISFNYINKDGGRTVLFTKSIYIINSSFMPTDVINKNIKIKSGESSFSIKLNQKYDEQYKDLSLISIKEGSNPITDFSKDEQNANEIIVTTSPITSDKTIIVSINSKEIEIQISILKTKKHKELIFLK